MRKIILFILLAISAMATNAQTNPKPGYVITNTGDTIRGVIDFRTNEKLSKQCDFWVNGGDVKTTYKPGDIEGFRFDHNGKYFVSRRLNVTGEPELYFAEFMVHGKMNLYCITHNSDEFYFFEREDGEIARLTNRATYYSGEGRQVLQEVKEGLQEKREQYGKVKSLLQKSWKAVEGMDDDNMSRKKLINVVRDYHNDVCTDGGKCMVYEYNEKSDKIKSCYKLFVGYASYTTEITDRQSFQDENYPGDAFEIGIGWECYLERVMRGLSVEIGVSYIPKYKSKHDFTYTQTVKAELIGDVSSTLEKSILNLSLGMVERLGRSKKVQPLVRGGIFVTTDMGTKEKNKVRPPYSTDVKDRNYDLGTYVAHPGAYIGIGAQMPLGKQFVRIHGDLHKAFTNGDMVKWGVTAEFGF